MRSIICIKRPRDGLIRLNEFNVNRKTLLKIEYSRKVLEVKGSLLYNLIEVRPTVKFLLLVNPSFTKGRQGATGRILELNCS